MIDVETHTNTHSHTRSAHAELCFREHVTNGVLKHCRLGMTEHAHVWLRVGGIRQKTSFEPHLLVVSTFFRVRIHPTGGRATAALTAVRPRDSHTSSSHKSVRAHSQAGARSHSRTCRRMHARTCNRTHAHEDARTLTHGHTHPQLNRRSGSKGGSGMHFKLGHRELLSYLAPLKPCSADASHELLRLRLIGLGTTEPPPYDGAGRPRGNACALGIRDRSSRCV